MVEPPPRAAFLKFELMLERMELVWPINQDEGGPSVLEVGNPLNWHPNRELGVLLRRCTSMAQTHRADRDVTAFCQSFPCALHTCAVSRTAGELVSTDGSVISPELIAGAKVRSQKMR